MNEQQVQTKIKRLLEGAGWKVLKIIQLSENGYPDIMALKDGRAVFIEVKSEGKKPRALQEYRIKELDSYGFKAFYTDLIVNMDQLKKLL